MNTIKQGSNEPDVILLQTFLGVKVDADFGPKTNAAFVNFQKKNNLKPDGLCGPKSWEKLFEVYGQPSIGESDYKFAAEYLGLPVATIKAVTEVEAAGKGFEKNHRPKSLFEGHILWSRLKKHSVKPENFVDRYTDILYKNWDRTKYIGGEKEWKRLEKAFEIHPEAALESASLGLFQIMGFNYEACGCKDIFEFYSMSFQSEGDQLLLFCRFCESQKLVGYLRDENWTEFAKRYNGPGYAQNNYDKKLETAFKKYNK